MTLIIIILLCTNEAVWPRSWVFVYTAGMSMKLNVELAVETEGIEIKIMNFSNWGGEALILHITWPNFPKSPPRHN